MSLPTFTPHTPTFHDDGTTVLPGWALTSATLTQGAGAVRLTATTTIDDMINTDDAGTVPTTVGGTNVARHVLIAGTVKTNGSNCTIQMRAVRGGTSNTITILAGSNMTAQKIQ